MSSEQKTIVINPELFNSSNKKKIKSGENNTTRKKERKSKPIIPEGTPNSKTLRKEFIKRIKEKQAESEKQYKLLQTQKNEKQLQTENSIKDSNKTFQDEFTKSLAYLTALTENRNKEKIKKKQEQKEQKKMNLTLKREKDSENYKKPEIQLELPDSLKPNLSEISLNINNLKPIINLNNNPNTLIKQHQFNNNNNINSNTYFNNNSENHTNYVPKPLLNNPVINIQTNVREIREPPPYGCLKGGSKPTYKEWSRHNRTLKSNNERNDISETKDRLIIQDFIQNNEISEREKRLQSLKNQYSVKHKIPQNDSNKKQKKYNFTRTIKKTTTVRNFKLGKNPKRKTISVLIKNGSTRKRIKTEVAGLKQKSLHEIKEYLRARNLLKVGSDAPPDVLRQMYETSILTGEINNLSSETLVHNFLNS